MTSNESFDQQRAEAAPSPAAIATEYAATLDGAVRILNGAVTQIELDDTDAAAKSAERGRACLADAAGLRREYRIATGRDIDEDSGWMEAERGFPIEGREQRGPDVIAEQVADRFMSIYYPAALALLQG
jgi:hypothetical protein